MIHIKTFENFHDDGLEIDAASSPKFNPVNRTKAKELVDNIFNLGAGAMVTLVCKEIGIKLPKTDKELDKAREIAIKYFIENPERIQEITPPEHKRYPYLSNDGISRTNNIGGVHHDKYQS